MTKDNNRPIRPQVVKAPAEPRRPLEGFLTPRLNKPKPELLEGGAGFFDLREADESLHHITWVDKL